MDKPTKQEDNAAVAAEKAKDAAEQARREVLELTNDEITQRIRMIEGNMRAMKVESQRLNHEASRVLPPIHIDQCRHQGKPNEDQTEQAASLAGVKRRRSLGP